MNNKAYWLASAVLMALPQVSNAQEAIAEEPDGGDNVIVVTAQRQAQSLQDVPIAVSAFSAEALESQQIENASDLQLTLPNVSFSKGNFTSASFTIRGVGDLCVGVTCDRTEEHTSELQSLMRISYAVFCLNKKTLQMTQIYRYISNTA